MKVAYIMNTLNRGMITPNVTEANVKNAGYDIDSFYITDQGSTDMVKDWVAEYATIAHLYDRNIGNPQALNQMTELATKHNNDIILIMGNDIEMPKNWLKQAVEVLKYAETGIVGWSWRGYQNEPVEYYGHKVVKDSKIFGCWAMRADTWRTVGYFSEFSKYGIWDSDYNTRSQFAGYSNFYLYGLHSKHLVNDVEHQTEYRLIKNEEMRKAAAKYQAMLPRYSKDCFYVDKWQNLKCKTVVMEL